MSHAYYVDKNGKVTKGSKKKKKQTEFLYTVDAKGKVTKNNNTEDIAPVKSKKKDKKDTWFKAGGFSDGVDSVGDFFGDLGETVVGTVGDVGVGLGKGLTRMGEGIGDALRYGVAGVADLTGNDNYAERLRKSAKENDTDDIWKKAEKKVDKNSVLGNKSDKVTEGLGQVAGIILTGGVAGGLGASAGVASAITTGTVGISGIGSGISEAYQSGATDKEAYTYGTIAGTGEALTELLFGGLGKTVKATGLSKGLSSADDMLAKKISGMFNNQIAKNFAEFGIKSGAEGTEEVLSGIISAVGKKVTYMEEEELSKILEDEDLLEQFVVGSITSGIAQSGVVPGMKQGSLIEANKQGKDFITGLTTNEQKVVDKEFENRISEAEKDGKKLSEKDKTKIYDEVLNDLDKGYISTDTIESAIGDKTYETYKTMEEQENSIREEIESLENTPDNQFTVKQRERLTELREELTKIDKTQVKNQLSSEVSELAKVDRLSESYNEKARRSETFKADLSKYDTKQQEVIKRATESGILNNTNRTHEFVDMVAKISADKGVLFDFTNNQKLKDSGFAVEGKTVNGYKTKDGNIGINIDSHKSLNSVVGHEITHVLEGTELYTELQEAVTNYAKTKGDYDTRYNELAELYKDIEDDIEGEVTADLVGDYLFTDKDFVNNLSVEKPNIFKKIFNEIKYLYKMATAGSKEARQLEKVKRTFENAYKENISKNSDTKHSFSGTRAKTANKSLLHEAEHMLDTGVDSETVRQETGWFKSYDGKMRFEIDDSQMKVYQNGDAVFSKSHPEYAELQELKKKKENSGITAEELSRLEELDKTWGNENERLNDLLRSGNLKLKHILEHDKLYENYPELKDMDIKIARSEEIGNGVRGSYNPSKKSITINEKLLGGDTSEVKKTLIHEIQHAIQDIEGFTSGSSEEYWQDRLDSGESIKTSEQKAKLQKLKKEYEDISKNEPEFFKEMNELEEMTPTVSRGAIDWDTLEKIEEDPIEWQNFDKKRDSLSEKYGEIKVYDFMDLQYEIKELERKSITASDAYYKTAGEIEARDTANRLSLNEEQRKATRPDIDKEDVVYSDNAKYSLSDSTGKELTKEQQDYFKDSKMRDDNGNLLVMYHGSRSGGFTVFDPKASDDNRSFFFSDKPSVASSYSDSENEIAPTGKEETKGLYKTYLNLKNPYIVDAKGNKWNNIVEHKEGDEFLSYIGQYMDIVTGMDSSLGLGDFLDSMNGDLVGSTEYAINELYIDEDTEESILTDDEQTKLREIAEQIDEVYNKWNEDEHLDEDGYGMSFEDYVRDNYNPKKTRQIAKEAQEKGYDGVIFKNLVDVGKFADMTQRNYEESTVAVAFDSNQIKSVTNETPTTDADIRFSLSKKGEQLAPYGNFNIYGKDVALQPKVEDAAPVQENVEKGTVEEKTNDVQQSQEEFEKLVQSYMDDAPAYMFDEDEIRAWAEEQARQNPQGATPTENTVIPESPLEERDIYTIGRDRKTNAYMYENPEVKPFFQEEAQKMLWELENSTDGKRGRKGASYGLGEEIGAFEGDWYGTKRQTSDELAYLRDNFKYDKDDLTKGLKAIIEDHGAENNAISKRIEFMLDERLREGYKDFMSNERMPANQDYINLLNEKQITEYSDEAFNNWAGSLKEDIAPVEENVEQNLYSMEDSKNNEINELDTKVEETEKADEPELTVNESFDAKINNYKDAIKGYKDSRVEIENAFDEAIENKTKEYDALKRKNTKKATNLLMQIENFKLRKANNLSNIDSRIEKTQNRIDNMIKNSETIKQGMYGKRRKALHIERMDEIKAKFLDKGFDFDTVLKNAKNKSTFSSVDNTPQRFMEKTLGYKEGQILADITVNKVAQNESAGIRWVNENVSLLKQISKEYGIKPRSKESAAAQMYAEGFYVNENDKLVKYGEKELALDFEDAEVRANIKKLAKDPRIRSIYDETLDQINKSRIRNAYPEIPKRDNYFLHFIEMDDAFSRLGIPFNPNDIRAKDLPTDLNGVTVDLKPGQPYFASQMHRKGHKTTYDLLGGVEKYLNSAKNQIYHIDDIQTLRATRNYIADMFGQAKGLEDLDTMTETEAAERIEQVFGSHLSNFAKFLHEEANVIAGKTALIDRGLEGIIGRKGITFLNTLNGQVGSNMVGFNASSSLTNFVSVMQSMAKSSKADTLKAFTQTVSNKIGSVFGRTDGFADNNPAIIRRKGIDTFARKPYEKISDSGYLFMSAIDDISTEIIVRTKFNELTRKGMSEEQAHIESDKWAHRILGDRSLGQQPLLYNSKMLGILTKFQLEVRNQLDSQFYDTIQEAKVSTEEIDNEIQKNAVKAAKIGSTMLQLAVLQHVFGKAFESVAGYNPAFDIIEVLMTTLGYDDEEDSKDTKLDNIEQGFLALLEDLPYSSILTGGRIPISSALPIKELVTGKDSYGQEKPRLETLKEVAPYYLLPTGYGQIKKTKQGLDMFSDEHPVSGSYTDKGDLRFPIEDTNGNRIQAGIFGQYANDNARYYFDNDIAPLNQKQIKEYKDVEMPIKDYWEYRDDMKGKKSIGDKADYISSLELPIDKKNILINNATTRKETIDMTDYEDYSSFNEFDFANKYPKKYKLLQDNNVSFEEYSKNEDTKAEYNWAFRNPKKYKMLQENNVSYKEYAKNEETKDAYDWAFRNPEKYTLSKAISSNLVTYRKYSKDIYNIRADKDKYGKSISGTKKKKVLKYINDLDADYGEKLILFKSVYDYDDTYNQEIVDYLNNREDITYDDMNTTLKELGFTVTADGTIYWN